MRLDFKILWFDDQPGSLSGIKETIKRHLSIKRGMKPVIREVTTIDHLESVLPQLERDINPDLIMMDWNMGQGTGKGSFTGAGAAKTIRKRFKYQEIIFYSAASPKELREAVFEQGIDGVFCVRRDNIGAESIGIIGNILQKLMDLNQMRGLVMSHVSELDAAICDCITKLHAEGSPELQQKILTSFHTRIKKYHEQMLFKLGEDSNGLTLPEYGKMSVLDTRCIILLKVLKELLPEDGNCEHLVETLQEIRAEVLKPRNALAHAKAVMRKGKEILEHNGEIYDNARFAHIRNALITHEDNLKCIGESIAAGRFTLVPSS